MKLLHTSDLHIGKALHNTSLIPDQEYMLFEILRIAEERNDDAVIIAGDIFDKSLPSGEAAAVFGRFVAAANEQGTKLVMISGNHDQAERIDFAKELLGKVGLSVKGIFDGAFEPAVLNDEFGEVRFYLLPFVRFANLRRFYPEAESFGDAVKLAVKAMDIDKSKRNVILVHETLSSGGEEAERSDSEELVIGGVSGIDAEIFSDFDYVALGHLHKPQKVGSENVRYSGSPLMYSLSELGTEKSVVEVTLGEKGEVGIELVPLKPVRRLVSIEGKLEDLLKLEPSEDLVCASVTDDRIQTDVMEKLRTVFPNILSAEQKNAMEYRGTVSLVNDEDIRLPMDELFYKFYTERNGGVSPDEEIMAEAREIIGGMEATE